jgi:polyisoprenoid-binding protein YceI
LLGSLLFLPLPGNAFSKLGEAAVVFTAAGPGGIKMGGKTSDLEIRDSAETLTLEVPLANLSTGIALRDRHMKEKYLEVPKYPSAELTVAKSALQIPASGAQIEADTKGTLRLHGREKPVAFHYQAKHTGDFYDVFGRMNINMHDFEIADPSYLGATVKPEVDITIRFRVKE